MKIMKNDTPNISIIMAAHNAERFLSEAISSVLYQGYRKLELLVINNRSDDRTYEIANSYSLQDARCKTFTVNSHGVSAARNFGIEKASGDFICFLDADDLFSYDSIQSRMEYFNANPQVDLIHGATLFIDESNRSLEFILKTNQTLFFNSMTGMRTHLNSFTGKSKIIKNFRFCENLTNGEDWRFLAEILLSGKRSMYLDKILSMYRMHRASTVLKNMKQHEKRLTDVIDWIYSAQEKTNIPQLKIDIPKWQIINARRLHLLNWLILSGDGAGAGEILADKNFSEWAQQQPMNTVINSVKMSGLRFFVHPFNQLSDLNRESKLKIQNNLGVTAIMRNHPNLARCFDRVFQF